MINEFTFGIICLTLGFGLLIFKFLNTKKEEDWDELNVLVKTNVIKTWGFILILVIIGLIYTFKDF